MGAVVQYGVVLFKMRTIRYKGVNTNTKTKKNR